MQASTPFAQDEDVYSNVENIDEQVGLFLRVLENKSHFLTQELGPDVLLDNFKSRKVLLTVVVFAID